MSKEVQKSQRARPDKKLLASPTPALLAALTLLSVSLRVTEGAAPAGDPSATPNAGANTAGVKLASSNKIKFTTTTKDKTETYRYSPSNKQQSNKHKLPATNSMKTPTSSGQK